MVEKPKSVSIAFIDFYIKRDMLIQGGWLLGIVSKGVHRLEFNGFFSFVESACGFSKTIKTVIYGIKVMKVINSSL